MEEMELSDPLIPTSMASSGSMQKDCYFYYYSSCNKGAQCPFRHEPAALGNETVCHFWAQGNCNKPKCIFRHLELTHCRNKIPCYFEKQPGGCKKVHCPFFHQNLLDQPRAEDIKKNPDLILPTSTSPAGSTKSSPSSSRSHTPVRLLSNFVISLSESDDEGESKEDPQPVRRHRKPMDEDYIKEIKLVKEVQHVQCAVMGHPMLSEFSELSDAVPQTIQPNQPQPMFVDEVEDVIEEIHEDLPEDAVAPANGASGMSPLRSISVIESFRDDTRNSFTKNPITSLARRDLLTPSRGTDEPLPVAASAPLRRRSEVRGRRSREGGVASVILADHIGTRAKPKSVQRSTEMNSNNSIRRRLQCRVAPFGDTRTTFSPPESNCIGNHFRASGERDISNVFSDRDRMDLHHGNNVRSKHRSDEVSQRRTSRAYRRMKNSPSDSLENLRRNTYDVRALGNNTNDAPRNGFAGKRASSPGEIRVKSLEEIRREKAAKQITEEGFSFHQRESPARGPMGNKRIRVKEEVHSFIPKISLHENSSLNSWSSFNSDEDQGFIEQRYYDPVFGCTYDGGSFYEERS